MGSSATSLGSKTWPLWRSYCSRAIYTGLGYGLFWLIKAIGLQRLTQISKRPAVQKSVLQFMRHFLNKKNAYIDRNLQLILAPHSEQQLNELKQAFSTQLLVTAAESITMDGSHFSKTDFVGIEHLGESPNGILFVATHMNNWEICRQNICLLGYPVYEQYRDFSQSHFDHRIYNHTHRFGDKQHFIPTSDTPCFVEKMQQGQHGYWFIDLKVKGGRNGALLGFCGAPAWTSTFGADIAIRCNKKIIPVYLERLADGRYRQTFAPPIDTSSGDALAVTQQLNNILSQPILENPASWCLWDTNRWGE